MCEASAAFEVVAEASDGVEAVRPYVLVVTTCHTYRDIMASLDAGEP